MSVKGLRKMIYPFAPDQSGASSVLYELGGMVIICDAGGCAGNVCGFDEPRWLSTGSAVFSAGLRDMDAILGRDDLLIDKIAKASGRLRASFIAIIGTPVPATIATDYKALRRMAEKRTALPVITVDTNGAGLYDEGASKAYLECFRRFAADHESAEGEAVQGIIPGSAGVIGFTPLDSGRSDEADRISGILKAEGCSALICYGRGNAAACNNGSAPYDNINEVNAADELTGLEAFRNAGRAERNIVISPSGLRSARYLQSRFGTPYECRDPLSGEIWKELEDQYAAECSGSLTDGLSGSRILIIHQQVRANSLREEIEKRQPDASEITVASWFMMDDELKREGDIHIKEEDDYFGLLEKGRFDVIIADRSLRAGAARRAGLFLDLPHFAVSGHYAGESNNRLYPER